MLFDTNIIIKWILQSKIKKLFILNDIDKCG